ncbi:TetR family transcriptional regulator [Jannaschia pagri]|uniref:TetR family transcriptional regulator n=1 Tax=Jannaschia pagri TaxID=2829797 RepID=A0ABQ4NRZ0_9RHOB|nr:MULTISPECIES: TetR/AcrR family transcriptional regulator [unclassified Jannaschia]GIT93017.1 TetR family transcriptional regulator [Jannaschia sp. AI_61]GIT96852.1 TetR family transcriptional regulator [Jannaschia sp. AI_62]
MPKPLIESKKKYHHGDLRGQLLEAVRQLIEISGPDGFSISEACRLAGVSTAAPYRHFADRTDILRGVVDLAMDRLQGAMQAASDAYPDDTIARVSAIGQAYIDFARHEPGVFRTMFGLTEGHGQDEDLLRKGQASLGVVRRAVAEHLGLAPETPEAGLKSYALWTFVHGHSFLVIDSKLETLEMPVPEDRLLDMVGRSILGPRAAG